MVVAALAGMLLAVCPMNKLNFTVKVVGVISEFEDYCECIYLLDFYL